MTRRNWEFPVALACFLLGVMIVIQFSSQQSEGFPLINQRTEELAKMLRDMEKERNRMQAEVAQLRDRLSDYEEAAGREQSLLNTMKNQLETARLEAGFIPVKGPGIVVSLNDSQRRPKADEDPYFYMIHDVDLQALVNELWATGAEAISINEQRMVATTAIRCAGPIIYANGVRLSPPYVTKAIGPASDLEKALQMPGGFMDALKPSVMYGVSINILQKEEVEIPGFEGSLIFRYAKPVVRQGGQ